MMAKSSATIAIENRRVQWVPVCNNHCACNKRGRSVAPFGVAYVHDNADRRREARAQLNFGVASDGV
jgi:hypothetical protein